MLAEAGNTCTYNFRFEAQIGLAGPPFILQRCFDAAFSTDWPNGVLGYLALSFALKFDMN